MGIFVRPSKLSLLSSFVLGVITCSDVVYSNRGAIGGLPTAFLWFDAAVIRRALWSMRSEEVTTAISSQHLIYRVVMDEVSVWKKLREESKERRGKQGKN